MVAAYTIVIMKNTAYTGKICPVVQKLLWDFIGDGIFNSNGRMRNACKTVRDFANDIIQSRRLEISKNEKIPNDLLSLCLNAVDEDERQLNDNELIDMILNLILAESNQVPTYDSLHEFVNITGTFYESLRLHPSVPANVKTCLKDDVLPGGVPIYAGEMVGWSLYTMGRAKETWGEDAHEFKPERFFKGKEIYKPNPYKYPMFNAGPRICLLQKFMFLGLGQQFAILETIIFVTSILREFKFEILQTKNPITAYEVSILGESSKA
ncbi:hypothetical protein G9A89_001236 [Geosiphon pyriformis]|nr:hypothetical protein G9A89_001236 [Geosiphon pyriformis]